LTVYLHQSIWQGYVNTSCFGFCCFINQQAELCSLHSDNQTAMQRMLKSITNEVIRWTFFSSTCKLLGKLWVWKHRFEEILNILRKVHFGDHLLLRKMPTSILLLALMLTYRLLNVDRIHVLPVLLFWVSAYP